MKELTGVKLFNQGIVSNPDQSDLSPESASDSDGVDANAQGKLQAVKVNSTKHATIGKAGKIFTNLEREDGKVDVVYSDGTNVKAIADFYNATPTESTLGVGNVTTMANTGRAIHMGLGDSVKWAGYVDSQQFNGTVEFIPDPGLTIAESTLYDGLEVVSIPDETSTYTVTIDGIETITPINPTVATYDVNTHVSYFTKNGHNLSTGDKIRIYPYHFAFYHHVPAIGWTWADVITNYNLSFEVTVNVTSLNEFNFTYDMFQYWSYGQGTGPFQANNFAWQIGGGATIYVCYTKTLADATLTYQKDSETPETGIKIVLGQDIVLTDGPTIRFSTDTTFYVGNSWEITNAANATTLIYADGAITPYEIQAISVTQGDAGEYFTMDKTYFYAYSMVYDTIQEAPLLKEVALISPLINVESMRIALAVNTTTISNRVTSINLYRADADTVNVLLPQTEYRLVQSISLTGWRISGDIATTIITDIGNEGPTYESNAGISEVLDNYSPTYGLSTTIGNVLFIADCTHPDLNDAAYTIMRSKPFRFNTFDWATESMRIGFIPKALASFNSRIYAFDNNRLLKINPELYVEDDISGIGCDNHKSWVVTPAGLIWANTTGAYLDDGKITLISEGISDQWTGCDRIIYDANTKQVLFYQGTTLYLYHLQLNRWDKILNFTTTVAGAFTGVVGETYTANSTELSKNFGGSTRRSLSWTSQEFTCETPEQLKWFYNCYVTITSGTLATLQFSLDGAAYADLTNTDEIKVGGVWPKGKKIKIKLTSTNGTIINSLAILFRREQGIR